MKNRVRLGKRSHSFQKAISDFKTKKLDELAACKGKRAFLMTEEPSEEASKTSRGARYFGKAISKQFLLYAYPRGHFFHDKMEDLTRGQEIIKDYFLLKFREQQLRNAEKLKRMEEMKRRRRQRRKEILEREESEETGNGGGTTRSRRPGREKHSKKGVGYQKMESIAVFNLRNRRLDTMNGGGRGGHGEKNRRKRVNFSSTIHTRSKGSRWVTESLKSKNTQKGSRAGPSPLKNGNKRGKNRVGRSHLPKKSIPSRFKKKEIKTKLSSESDSNIDSAAASMFNFEGSIAGPEQISPIKHHRVDLNKSLHKNKGEESRGREQDSEFQDLNQSQFPGISRSRNRNIHTELITSFGRGFQEGESRDGRPKMYGRQMTYSKGYSYQRGLTQSGVGAGRQNKKKEMSLRQQVLKNSMNLAGVNVEMMIPRKLSNPIEGQGQTSNSLLEETLHQSDDSETNIADDSIGRMKFESLQAVPTSMLHKQSRKVGSSKAIVLGIPKSRNYQAIGSSPSPKSSFGSRGGRIFRKNPKKFLIPIKSRSRDSQNRSKNKLRSRLLPIKKEERESVRRKFSKTAATSASVFRAVKNKKRRKKGEKSNNFTSKLESVKKNHQVVLDPDKLFAQRPQKTPKNRLSGHSESSDLHLPKTTITSKLDMGKRSHGSLKKRPKVRVGRQTSIGMRENSKPQKIKKRRKVLDLRGRGSDFQTSFTSFQRSSFGSMNQIQYSRRDKSSVEQVEGENLAWLDYSAASVYIDKRYRPVTEGNGRNRIIRTFFKRVK